MSDNGSIGRFSDRLKKMRRDRLRIRKYGKDVSLENIDTKKKGDGYLVNLLLIPVVFLNGFFGFSKDSDNISKDKSVNIKKKKLFNRDNSKDIENDNYLDKLNINNENLEKENLVVKEDFDMSDSKGNQDKEMKVGFNEIDSSLDEISKLEKEILSLIKKALVKNINELELIQTDLYVLSQINNNDIELKKCQDDIKEIKRLLSKIKSLKEKYDYLKDTYDFEYLDQYGDSILGEKINRLKNLCDNSKIGNLIDNYKIMDEYKYLYLKIDKIQRDTDEYKKYKDNKVEELQLRDESFDEFKNKLFNVDSINKSYEEFVTKQNNIIKDLDDKIGKIDSHLYIDYKLKGFNKLLGNSFKYFGLLMLSPLKGLIPSIAVQTMATRECVVNLYNNLKWEENRSLFYTAIDYTNVIMSSLNDIGNASKLIDDTLSDIGKLKEEFNTKFKGYEDNFSEYKDTIKKINKIENAIMGNKIKVEMMMNRLKENEKINDEKLKKVKKMNND